MKQTIQMLPLLRSHLRRSHQAEITGHCDAETLAAFVERTLDRTERTPVADHLSQCQNCRDVLALASQATLSSNRTRPAKTRFYGKGLYATAALAALCIAAVLFHPSKTAPPQPQQQQTIASTNPPPAPNSVRPPGFSPHVTGAQVIVPVLTVPTPLWRVISSRSPTALEISYNGGATWTPIRTPAFQPKSVAAKGANVWVADAQGTVLESTDFGLHWTRLPRAIHPTVSGR